MTIHEMQQSLNDLYEISTKAQSMFFQFEQLLTQLFDANAEIHQLRNTVNQQHAEINVIKERLARLQMEN